ncbi:MAG: class I SAM-dependent methyltransferase [Actinomycetota bacterium]
MERERSLIRSEFERAAGTFAERTAGRFDDMDVPRFSRVQPGELVLEVGVGTGNFLSLFSHMTDRLLGVDVTLGMLRQARVHHSGLALAVADGARLPFASRSIDVVASAQMLHHVRGPLPVLKEMRRVGGRVLLVDQVATENYEQTVVRNALEVLRDPSHAASRPASAYRVLLQAAGLTPVDERIWEGPQRLSQWMWPGEFPDERIEAVRAFIEEHGRETGMGFERDGDDWIFTRRRIMLLAERNAGAGGPGLRR